MLQKNELILEEIAEHDYYWNYGNVLAASDKEHEDANKKWVNYVRRVRDMKNLFLLLIGRMENEILTLDQKQLLANLLTLQYISKLDECRIDYQGLFSNLEQHRPEQLVIMDEQRERLFSYEQTLQDRINEDSIPFG